MKTVENKAMCLENKHFYDQISQNCISKLVDCLEGFNKGEIGADIFF
jgi:hypothetical protein